jgi:hypothetical protein
MPTPLKYSKVKVIKITDQQHQTLKKLDSYQINVAQFIRDAISEKIKRDYKELILKPKKEYCPF